VKGERLIAGLWCSQVLEALGDYVDDALAAEHRQAVESHVSECPDCARFGGGYAAVVEAIRASSAALPDATLAALKNKLRALSSQG